jgi:hypothetical protein
VALKGDFWKVTIKIISSGVAARTFNVTFWLLVLNWEVKVRYVVIERVALVSYAKT